MVICEVQETDKVIKQIWERLFRWRYKTDGKDQDQMECGTAAPSDESLEQVTIATLPYFEDNEACGYCNRQPNTKHEAWCRQ